MVKAYTIEWYDLRETAGKSQCYKLRIGLRQGKRLFQYLIRFKDILCADAIRSCVPAERDGELSLIIRTLFEERHLKCPAVNVNVLSQYMYRQRLRQQSCVMKRFLADYIHFDRCHWDEGDID